MALTLAHLTYDLQEIASSGGNPNSFKITIEQLEYWVEQVRSQLISQSISLFTLINESFLVSNLIIVLKCVFITLFKNFSLS